MIESQDRIFDIEICMDPQKVVKDIKKMIVKSINYQAVSKEEKELITNLGKKLEDILTEYVLVRKNQIEGRK